MNFFESFPEYSLSSTVLKKKKNKTIKRIGHHARLRDVMDQFYPTYGCTRANTRVLHWSMLHFAAVGCMKLVPKLILGKTLDR